jgi:uncharacterized Ntn-hydrolase superfamily protein
VKLLVPSRILSRAAPILAAAALLAPAVPATWSIIAVNTRTGEVCIATATCLSDVNLQGLTPVLRVGVGGACAQSLGDGSGFNRTRIWNGLIAGWSPEQILTELSMGDNQFQRRQYGIVNMAHEPVTFSGVLDGQAYYGVARTNDDLRYAIQGNVLTGIQVITHAENLFLQTEGDLGQKVMAAMEGARLYGGDGRCSCNESNPTICGCPPPPFEYSAFTATWVLARIGDVDDDACPDQGCIGGQYFGNLNVISGYRGPEPVLVLEEQYAAWRASLAGRVDQLRTTVVPTAPSLPADQRTTLDVDVLLKDIDGAPVLDPLTTITVARAYDGPPVAKIGSITTVSAGHLRIRVRAGAHVGEGRWRLTAHQGGQDVLLWPELVIPVVPDPGH